MDTRLRIINEIKVQVAKAGGEQELIDAVYAELKVKSAVAYSIVRDSGFFDTGLIKLYRLIAEYSDLFFLSYWHALDTARIIADNLNSLDWGCPIVQDIISA